MNKDFPYPYEMFKIPVGLPPVIETSYYPESGDTITKVYDPNTQIGIAQRNNSITGEISTSTYYPSFGTIDVRYDPCTGKTITRTYDVEHFTLVFSEYDPYTNTTQNYVSNNFIEMLMMNQFYPDSVMEELFPPVNIDYMPGEMLTETYYYQ